ncbi:glyoxalase [Rhodococcus sp. 06-462-5]|uniref:VOC family protein n=1 Tax=unclassified Rhodococcus (in: high G+C Gram-positive bacteria) TaxID=192944 RepID=UPI000B9B7DF7|nr:MULTISPECIES: VOC family protein [unclassified Rhodococcus (in: high G+C Gram-positive bacteria)]OZC76513.1 glyoxalase [Rhodococcus sp. 06-462-5]OZE64570.1 glyoxalase [Rhodococcus sp. 02-925g]
MTRPTITVDYTVLDCPDPAALGRFYSTILGWEPVRDDGDWVVVHGPGELRLAFQKAPDFTPIDWPSEGIKIHLDLVVDDMEQARDFVVDAGAELIDHAQPSFWVFRDPAGHIFCLCKRD